MVAVCIPSIGRSGSMLPELIDVLVAEPCVNAIEIWDNSDSGYWYTAWPSKVEVVYAPGISIYQEWNYFGQAWNQISDMAFLNDDIVMAPGTIPALLEALTRCEMVTVAAGQQKAEIKDTTWLREVEGTYRLGGANCWAFMVRRGSWPAEGIDERFQVWLGDDDLVMKVRQRGGRVCVLEGVTVRHAHSMTVNSLPNISDIQAADVAYWRSLGRPW